MGVVWIESADGTVETAMKNVAKALEDSKNLAFLPPEDLKDYTDPALREQKEAAMDRFINDYRQLVGIHITYKTGVREMFQMLQKGWAIGLIMDQDTSRHDGVVLDFFGRPTNCVVGPASIARFRAASTIPCCRPRTNSGLMISLPNRTSKPIE